MLVDKIGNYRETVTSSWAYNHKHVLITISLLVSLLWVYFGDVILPANVPLIYTAPCEELDCIIEERAMEYFEKNQALYYEMARTDAMESVGRELVSIMYEPIK